MATAGERKTGPARTTGPVKPWVTHTRSAPVADTASGLVEFIAEFDNLDGAVRPGLTG